MVKALLEWETIDADQINDIMSGHVPRSPKSSAGQNSTTGTPPVTPAGGAPAAA
jgi:cell division protease FtsH